MMAQAQLVVQIIYSFYVQDTWVVLNYNEYNNYRKTVKTQIPNTEN